MQVTVSCVWSAILNLPSQGCVPAPWLVHLAMATYHEDEPNAIVFLVFVTPLTLPDGPYYEGFLPAVLNAFEPNPLNPNPFFINSM